MSNFAFGKGSKSKLYGDDTHPPVHPDIIKLANKALKYSTVDFSVIDGVRTSVEQRAMFDKGNSELDGVHKISDHQRRMAIDFLPIVHSPSGIKLNPYDVKNPLIVGAWLEVFRAFMRASFKLGLVLEFGVGYNIGSGRDYAHLSIKGRVPADYSGMAVLD